jgi:hypothetical protein
LHKIYECGKKLNDRVEVNGEVKMPSIANMIKGGKKMEELKRTLPYTLEEMITNGKGGVKAGGKEIETAIFNASKAKIENLTTLPPRIKSDHEIEADTLLTLELKTLLKDYYKHDSAKCKEIMKMKKYELLSEDVPESLTLLLILYWETNSDAFQLFKERIRIPEKSKEQKIAEKMNVKEMQKILLEYYTILKPDEEMCKAINVLKIKKAVIVSMMLVYWSVEDIDPSVVL